MFEPILGQTSETRAEIFKTNQIMRIVKMMMLKILKRSANPLRPNEKQIHNRVIASSGVYGIKPLVGKGRCGKWQRIIRLHFNSGE